MIRWSFQSAHGCVPVAPSRSPIGSTSACSCERRSAITPGTSAKVSHRPVRTSTSDAISSPTRCSSSCGAPRRRLHVLEAVGEVERAGSRSANSSSTATVKSVAVLELRSRTRSARPGRVSVRRPSAHYSSESVGANPCQRRSGATRRQAIPLPGARRHRPHAATRDVDLVDSRAFEGGRGFERDRLPVGLHVS